nr:MAG TPA: hypothetical protein [Caudoviricetes sp.]
MACLRARRFPGFYSLQPRLELLTTDSIPCYPCCGR